MAEDSANVASFLDRQRQHELEITPYLSEDLQKNWHQMWSNHVVNPENKFVETAAYFEARRRLWYTGFLTICGHIGDGKSCLAEHLVCSFVRGPWKYPENTNFSPDQSRLRLERSKYRVIAINEESRDCYTPLIVTSPEEYLQKVDHSLNQIVFIDDIFGKAAFDWSLMERWRPLLEDMLWNISKARPRTLVVLCVNKAHLERTPGEIIQLEWFREGVMVDLTDSYKPSNTERIDLLNSSRLQLLPKADIDKSGHTKVQKSIGLVYRMYNQVKAFSMEGKQFFTNPWQMCIKSIEEMFMFDKILYYTLCVAVMHDGKLDLSHASLRQCDLHVIRVMQELGSVQGLPSDLDLDKIRFAARLLTGFFFKPVQKWVFEFTHPKIHYICALSLCKSLMGKVIELASRKFIMDHIRVLDVNESREDELVIKCEPLYYIALAKRFTAEILNGHLVTMIRNESCESEDFVNVWFKDMKESRQLELILRMKDRVLNRSMMYWACFYGNGVLVKAILQVVNEFNLLSDESFKKELVWGMQAACSSTAKWALLAVNCLIQQGVYVNLTENYQGDNAADVFGREMCMLMKLEAAPIHVAAFKGHPEVIQLLLDNGAHINETTADQMTPLHRAAMRRDKFATDVVNVLIRNNPEIDAKSLDNQTPLDKAAKCGCSGSALALIAAGAGGDIENYIEMKKLVAGAVMNRQHRLVEYLLKKDRTGTKEIHSAIPYAIYNRDIRMIELMVDIEHIDLDVPCDRMPPLHTACYYGEMEIAKLLIEKGANVNGERGKFRQTPLHYAAKAGMYEMCQLLLSHGAKTEAQNEQHETPLVLAAKGKHQMVVWLLLREGMKLGVDEVFQDN